MHSLSLSLSSHHEEFFCFVLVQKAGAEQALDGVSAVVEDRPGGLVCLHRQSNSRVLLPHVPCRKRKERERERRERECQPLGSYKVTVEGGIITKLQV